MRACFSKQSRLLKKYQFLRVVRYGKRHAGNFLVVESVKNRLNRSRLGITVSRKFGKAVQRNRFKRLIREGFRQLGSLRNSGIDIHVKPRSKAKDVDFEMMRTELSALLKFVLESC